MTILINKWIFKDIKCIYNIVWKLGFYKILVFGYNSKEIVLNVLKFVIMDYCYYNGEIFQNNGFKVKIVLYPFLFKIIWIVI